VVEDLMNFLGDPADLQTRIRILGALLKQLKGVREQADYDISDTFTILQGTEALIQAQRISARAAQLPRK
jgi:hypothetical protein